MQDNSKVVPNFIKFNYIAPSDTGLIQIFTGRAEDAGEYEL